MIQTWEKFGSAFAPQATTTRRPLDSPPELAELFQHIENLRVIDAAPNEPADEDGDMADQFAPGAPPSVDLEEEGALEDVGDVKHYF